MQSGRFFEFIGSDSFSISWCPLSWLSIGCILLVLNDISWYYILHILEHLINYIFSMFQLTSGLCLTNQLYSKNMSMLFKSMTAISMFSLCLFISTSSSTYHITSPLLVLSVLKTSNNLSIGSILIFSSFTSYSSIPMCIHPKSTSIYNCSFFLFFVLILVCIFNSLSLFFLSILNNISILGIIMYRGLLYHAYSKPLTKFFCLLLLSSLDSSWTLLFFIFCYDLQSLAMCLILLYL